MIGFKKNTEVLFSVIICFILTFISIKQFNLLRDLKELRTKVDAMDESSLSKDKKTEKKKTLALKFENRSFCSISKDERVLIRFLDNEKKVKVSVFSSCLNNEGEREISGKFWSQKGATYIELNDGSKNELFKMTGIILNSNGVMDSFFVDEKEFRKDLCKKMSLECNKN